MVAINELWHTRDVANLLGCSRPGLHARIKAGPIKPVIGYGKKNSQHYYSFPQVLALYKREELVKHGASKAGATQVARIIGAFEDVDALVDSGRRYLVLCGDDCYGTPMTIEQVREFVADMTALAEKVVPPEKRNQPVAVLCIVDFGLTWTALKPLLLERAAIQQDAA